MKKMDRNQQLAKLQGLLTRRSHALETVLNLENKLAPVKKELAALEADINQAIILLYPTTLPALPQEHEGRAFRDDEGNLPQVKNLPAQANPVEVTHYIPMTPDIVPEAVTPNMPCIKTFLPISINPEGEVNTFKIKYEDGTTAIKTFDTTDKYYVTFYRGKASLMYQVEDPGPNIYLDENGNPLNLSTKYPYLKGTDGAPIVTESLPCPSGKTIGIKTASGAMAMTIQEKKKYYLLTPENHKKFWFKED